jgi:hypothetical protein
MYMYVLYSTFFSPSFSTFLVPGMEMDFMFISESCLTADSLTFIDAGAAE